MASVQPSAGHNQDDLLENRQKQLIREALDRVRYDESERLQQEADKRQAKPKTDQLPLSWLIGCIVGLLVLGTASSYLLGLFLK